MTSLDGAAEDVAPQSICDAIIVAPGKISSEDVRIRNLMMTRLMGMREPIEYNQPPFSVPFKVRTGAKHPISLWRAKLVLGKPVERCASALRRLHVDMVWLWRRAVYKVALEGSPHFASVKGQCAPGLLTRRSTVSAKKLSSDSVASAARALGGRYQKTLRISPRQLKSFEGQHPGGYRDVERFLEALDLRLMECEEDLAAMFCHEEFGLDVREPEPYDALKSERGDWVVFFKAGMASVTLPPADRLFHFL